MHTLSKILVSIGLLTILSACGQKGPIEIVPRDRTDAEVITDIEESVGTKTTQTQEPELTK